MSNLFLNMNKQQGYLGQTSDQAYLGNSSYTNSFELLNLIPNDHLLFKWNDDYIFDDFQSNSYRFIVLDDKHAYIRSFHKFWIENVEESWKKEMMKEQ